MKFCLNLSVELPKVCDLSYDIESVHILLYDGVGDFHYLYTDQKTINWPELHLIRLEIINWPALQNLWSCRRPWPLPAFCCPRPRTSRVASAQSFSEWSNLRHHRHLLSRLHHQGHCLHRLLQRRPSRYHQFYLLLVLWQILTDSETVTC